MPKIFMTLTLNQRLAATAFLLGLLAIGASPTRGERVTIDARAMARLVAGRSDRVTAPALADWIIQGRSDFRLVDLRSPEAFAAGPRIPTAENVAVEALLDAGLGRNETILLVGDDEATVAQAWFLLEASGYKGAAIVDGGLRAWREQVVYPRIDGVDPALRAKREAVSAHFGGASRTGAGPDATDLPSAASAAKAAPDVPRLPAAGKKPGPAKKREGC